MAHTIEPKRNYTLYEIVTLKLIPGVDNAVKATRLVQRDALEDRILSATRVKVGNAVKYQVLGKNIIRYLKLN